MTSLGRDAYTENLTVTRVGDKQNPVHTIYRASTDYYQNDLNWIETDSDQLRFRLKEDGHLQIVEGLELFHGTEDIRTATKQFSVGLNSTGGFVIRDEVNGVDVLTVASGQPLSLPITAITGLQQALDAQQTQFMTSGGLSVSSTVLDTFGLTAGGDGTSYDRSLVTAGAIENFLEAFQEGFISVLPGQDSGHRVGAIAVTPSSVNVPSCLAVANHVTSKLNSFTGNVGTPFKALKYELPNDVVISSHDDEATTTRDITFVLIQGFSTNMKLENTNQDFSSFVVGETVTVSGFTTPIAGIEPADLNRQHVVNTVDPDYIRVTLSVQSNFEGYNSFVTGITAARTFVSEAGVGVRVADGGGVGKAVHASDFVLLGGDSLQTLIAAKQPAGDYALNSLVNTKIDQAFADGRYQQLADVPAAQIYSGRTSPGLQAYIQQSSTVSNQFTVSFFVHTGPENFHLQAFELAVFWRQARCQLAFISVGNEAHPWDGVTDALQQPSTSPAQPLPQRRLWTVGSGYTAYSTIAQTAQPDQYYDLPSYRVVFTQSTIDEGTSVWNQPNLPSYEFNKNNGSCFVATLVFDIIGDWSGTQEVLFQANSRGFVNQGTQNFDSLVLHPTIDDGFNYAFRDQFGNWDQSNRIPILDVTSDGVDKFDGYYQRGLKLQTTDIKDDAITTTTATVTTLASTALTKGGTNVLNETETDGRYATQTALNNYGGNPAVPFNALTVTLNNQVKYAAVNYSTGFVSFLALAVLNNIDNTYLPVFCSDIRYGPNAETRLTTTISELWGGLAGRHPLTPVDELAGGTLSSSSLITSGAVHAGNANLQTQIDGKQPAGSYLTAVPANTNANLIADGTVSNTMFQYLGGVTSNIQTQLNGKAANFSTDSTPTSGSSNLVTSGGVFDAINAADHVTPIHDGILSVSGNMTCAATLRADGSLRCEGAATFNSAVIAGSGYFQSPDFRHTGATISLGLSSGSGALNGVAIGVEAGRWAQSTGGIAVGLRAGLSVQATDSICIGTDAGRENAGARSINIGRQANFAGAGVDSIGIGNACGNLLGARAITIGIGAGVNAADECVCLGPYAGGIAPDRRSVCIGASAGFNSAGEEGICIGYLASNTGVQGIRGIAIGTSAGLNQGNEAIAVGWASGNSALLRSVSIGLASGVSAGAHCIAIGSFSGKNTASRTIALGESAGANGMGAHSIACGLKAGESNQGSNCIALGAFAAGLNQHNNSICINATGLSVQTSATNATYIAPLRLSVGTNLMQYNTSTLEVTYSNVVSATLSCAGVIASTLSASQITTPSLSVASIAIGSSIALPSSVQYVAIRHSYVNTLTSGSTANYSDASSFTNIVLGNDFGTWGLGISFRAAFNDTGYSEHGGSGVFTPKSDYGFRLFRVSCSITAALTGTAAIYLEIVRNGTALAGARLPVANCTTTVESLVELDGTTDSVTFRLHNQSSGTWTLALTHTEPYLAAMNWQLQ